MNHTIRTIADLANLYAEINAQICAGGECEVAVKSKGRRTDQQRKAIEVYCRELATALNDAGCDQRKVLAAMKEGVEIPWSQESVKSSLWKGIQIAVVEKQSTTQLTKDEVSEVYEILNRWTAQTFGVSVPFPEREI